MVVYRVPGTYQVLFLTFPHHGPALAISFALRRRMGEISLGPPTIFLSGDVGGSVCRME